MCQKFGQLISISLTHSLPRQKNENLRNVPEDIFLAFDSILTPNQEYNKKKLFKNVYNPDKPTSHI